MVGSCAAIVYPPFLKKEWGQKGFSHPSTLFYPTFPKKTSAPPKFWKEFPKCLQLEGPYWKV